MDIKKIFKKIVEILLIVILCVAVTRFFINKEQKQKKDTAVSQESSGKEKSDKNYAQYKNNKNSVTILEEIFTEPIRKKPFHQGTENIK